MSKRSMPGALEQKIYDVIVQEGPKRNKELMAALGKPSGAISVTMQKSSRFIKLEDGSWDVATPASMTRGKHVRKSRTSPDTPVQQPAVNGSVDWISIRAAHEYVQQCGSVQRAKEALEQYQEASEIFAG